MRLDLFSKGDKVLLLGEGNFSFAKCLVSHKLPIEITATCFNNGETYNGQADNINFLRSKNIPVLLDVDATRLYTHSTLKDKKFSKIIFNFPHVGSKMMIHLNRDLIKNICTSCSNLLPNNGQLILTLCNGQGGTPADNPKRKWFDSWQVTEMAAYGKLSLISVEPFDFNKFDSYNCTGYRNQDIKFNLNGALVHVFKKKEESCKGDISKRLLLTPLFDNSDILVPIYYSELYSKYPLNNSGSAINFFKECFMKKIDNVMLMNDLSLCVKDNVGVECEVKGIKMRLRRSALQVVDEIVEKCAGEVNLFIGMFFNDLLCDDFDDVPPIGVQFVLHGQNVCNYFNEFLYDLAALFDNNLVNDFSSKIIRNLGDFSFLDNENCEFKQWECSSFILAHEIDFKGKMSQLLVMYVENIARVFLNIESWKQLWSDDNTLQMNRKLPPKLVLHPGVLYPLTYEFDITLKYDDELIDSEVFEIIRIGALESVKKVSLIDEYHSPEGWSSKCFRITYQSYNEPLNKTKVLHIHNNVIGMLLKKALSVTIK